MKHDISLWKDDLDSSFKVYHELMAHRIHDILLILSPYDAFINYMNVLSDFEIRVNAAVQSTVDDQVARLSKIIKEKDEQLARLEQRLTSKKSPKKVTAAGTGAAEKSAKTEKGASAKKAVPVKKSAPVKKSTAAKTAASSKPSQTRKKI